ncbi:PTS sugar transporter subunit IIA [Glaesserella sp.]|uniref:PTS sugar transporter subunit IIA n=1 Tax=Glaesserella sp. TaxID=2094731 RepID=UPI0035A1C31D
MKLTAFLSPSHIHQGVILSSKKRALELIGKIVAEQINQEFKCDKQHELCPVDCFSNLFKREKLGSTAINNGVALPHAKLPANSALLLEKPIAVFLQLEMPIDYEASDNKEVDLIYAILFPENSCDRYKGALQDIAQQLSDKNLLKHLRSAKSVEELWQVLEYADNQQMNNDESEKN